MIKPNPDKAYFRVDNIFINFNQLQGGNNIAYNKQINRIRKQAHELIREVARLYLNKIQRDLFIYQILFYCIKCSNMIRDTFKLVYNYLAMILKCCYFFYVLVYSIHPLKLVNMTKESVDIPIL